MSDKQNLYLDMLWHAFLTLRNKSSDANTCICLADLLHDVPTYLQSSEYEQGDYYFLTIEFPGYLKQTQDSGRQIDTHMVALIEKLRSAAPLPMRLQLAGSHVAKGG